MKYCSKCVLWTIIVIGFLLCILFTLYLYYAANILHVSAAFDAVVREGDKVFHWGNTTFDSVVEKVALFLPNDAQIPDYLLSNDATQQYWAIAAYVMTAFTVVLFFVIIAAGDSISVSVKIIKDASNVLRSIPALFMWRCIFALILVCRSSLPF